MLACGGDSRILYLTDLSTHLLQLYASPIVKGEVFVQEGCSYHLQNSSTVP